jgi:ribokinase
MPAQQTPFDVISVGDVIIDLISTVDRLPGLDEEVEIYELEIHGGGASANSAVGLAKLGLKVGFVGAVGNDEFGRFLIQCFNGDNVDRSGLKVVPVPSGLVFGSVIRSTGERALFSYEGANLALSTSEIDWDYVGRARAILMSGTKLDLAEEVAKYGATRSQRVYYDPGSITVSKGLQYIRNVISDVNILALNKAETNMLFPGFAFEEVAERLLGYGPEMLIIKLGKDGCYVRTETEESRAPAFKVKAVDTTGAGDAFNAAFLYCLLKGFTLSDSAIFSNAAAALKMMRKGARSVATLDEISKFLKENSSTSGLKAMI